MTSTFPTKDTNFPFTFIQLAIDTCAKNRDPCNSTTGGLIQSILSLGTLSQKKHLTVKSYATLSQNHTQGKGPDTPASYLFTAFKRCRISQGSLC